MCGTGGHALLLFVVVVARTEWLSCTLAYKYIYMCTSRANRAQLTGGDAEEHHYRREETSFEETLPLLSSINVGKFFFHREGNVHRR